MSGTTHDVSILSTIGKMLTEDSSAADNEFVDESNLEDDYDLEEDMPCPQCTTPVGSDVEVCPQCSYRLIINPEDEAERHMFVLKTEEASKIVLGNNVKLKKPVAGLDVGTLVVVAVDDGPKSLIYGVKYTLKQQDGTTYEDVAESDFIVEMSDGLKRQNYFLAGMCLICGKAEYMHRPIEEIRKALLEAEYGAIGMLGDTYVMGDPCVAHRKNMVSVMDELRGKNVVKIISGHLATNSYFGLTADGAVFSWGDAHPILAQPREKFQDCKRPTMITMFQRERVAIRHISCGPKHCCGLSGDGELFVWGEGPGLGVGNPKGKQKPQYEPVLNDNGFLADKKCRWVSAGHTMSYAVTDTGIGVTWGEGDKGQLGHSLQHKPVYIPTALQGDELKMSKDVGLVRGAASKNACYGVSADKNEQLALKEVRRMDREVEMSKAGMKAHRVAFQKKWKELDEALAREWKVIEQNESALPQYIFYDDEGGQADNDDAADDENALGDGGGKEVGTEANLVDKHDAVLKELRFMDMTGVSFQASTDEARLSAEENVRNYRDQRKALKDSLESCDEEMYDQIKQDIETIERNLTESEDVLINLSMDKNHFEMLRLLSHKCQLERYNQRIAYYKNVEVVERRHEGKKYVDQATAIHQTLSKCDLGHEETRQVTGHKKVHKSAFDGQEIDIKHDLVFDLKKTVEQSAQALPDAEQMLLEEELRIQEMEADPNEDAILLDMRIFLREILEENMALRENLHHCYEVAFEDLYSDIDQFQKLFPDGRGGGISGRLTMQEKLPIPLKPF